MTNLKKLRLPHYIRIGYYNHQTKSFEYEIRPSYSFFSREETKDKAHKIAQEIIHGLNL